MAGPGTQTRVAEAEERAICVDVVLATRNRPSDLQRLLPTLLAQTHARYQCLLVDQSDDPGPNDAFVRAQGDPRIRHVVQHARGKSLALNLALARGAASVVAFTDDDCTLPTDWLERGLAALARQPCPGVVFGNVLPARHDPAQWFIPTVTFPCRREINPPLRRSPGLIGMGANMFVGRSVFQKVGLFDEDLGPGGRLFTGEECEFAYRALRYRFPVFQDPSVAVWHWGARPRAGGVARRLATTGLFAIGAGLGKHLRSGDWRAAWISMDETAATLAQVARAVARRESPLHLRRLAAFWKGVVVGIGRGPRVPTAPR